MIKLIHQELVQLANILGYDIGNDGICKGFSGMWAQAILAGDEESFKQRLLFITSYKNNFAQLKQDIEAARAKVKHSPKTIDSKTIQLLEVLAFFDGMKLYFRPYLCNDVFGVKAWVNQDDLRMIYPVAKSQKQEEAGKDIAILLDKSYAGDEISLTNYFNDLKAILNETGLSAPILLDSGSHSICVKYNKFQDTWSYVDVEDFRRYPYHNSYVRELTLDEMVPSILDSLNLGDKLPYTVFNTTVLANDVDNTPLVRAAFAAFDLKYLLPKHPDMFDGNGDGLMHVACQNGHLRLVQELIKQNIDINETNYHSYAPLHIACLRGNLQIVQELIKQKTIHFNPREKIGATPFYLACQNGHLPIVQELLNHKAIAINKATYTGKATPFYIACQNGHTEIVRLLMKQAKIDINQGMEDGATPLHIACYRGRLEIVQELLQQKNIRINQAKRGGDTPLFLACQSGCLPIVRELIKQETIDVNKALVNEVTPLHIACFNGRTEIVTVLLQSHKIANINQRSKGIENSTPLQVACLSSVNKENAKLFQVLLAHGASMTDKDDNGRTALDIAFEESNDSAIRELLTFAQDHQLDLTDIMSADSLEKAKDWCNHKAHAEYLNDYLSTHNAVTLSM